MERLYTVKDFCAIFQVKPTTARKYLRDMEHMEEPLMVTERAVRAWEHRKTVPGAETIREMMKKGGAKRAG